jgi:hypothetical protein
MIGIEASLADEQERLRWRHERVKFRPPSFPTEGHDVVRNFCLGQTALVWMPVVKMSILSMTGTACLMHTIAGATERQALKRTVVISSL